MVFYYIVAGNVSCSNNIFYSDILTINAIQSQSMPSIYYGHQTNDIDINRYIIHRKDSNSEINICRSNSPARNSKQRPQVAIIDYFYVMYYCRFKFNGLSVRRFPGVTGCGSTPGQSRCGSGHRARVQVQRHRPDGGLQDTH